MHITLHNIRRKGTTPFAFVRAGADRIAAGGYSGIR